MASSLASRNIGALQRRQLTARPSAARPRALTSISAQAGRVYKVTFKFPKQGREETIECAEDCFILDAVEASGADLPFTCQAGGCSSCAGKVLAGSVDQSCQRVLSDEEVAKGWAMLCTSYPTSDCVIQINQEGCCA